jgi:hypothetical protein
MRFLC